MSLKRNNQVQAAFSMASMTDVIFLLLVFFMVTSTFMFPTAMEVDLPQGTEQTSVKPSTRVYIDSIGTIGATYADGDMQIFADPEQLGTYLDLSMRQDTTQTAVAIYADTRVPYGRIVDVLNVGARQGIKMVLATKPTASKPAAAATAPAAPAPDAAPSPAPQQ